jgi:4-hydroxythreonine-4-phosphate dehydrogenase
MSCEEDVLRSNAALGGENAAHEWESTLAKPVIAISMGDVNGIGPEILAKSLQDRDLWNVCRPVVFGAPEALEAEREFAPRLPETAAAASVEEALQCAGDAIPVVNPSDAAPRRRPGEMLEDAGRAAVEWFEAAVESAKAEEVNAVVTCPISKLNTQNAGYGDIGHTEILQRLTGVERVGMSLFSDRMRIVHISEHASLAEALGMINTERIIEAVRMGAEALTWLSLKRRRIAVAGVNPHAGEAGVLGREELDQVEPAVRACAAEGVDCSGPYSPDTVFRRMWDGEFDLVVAMYHDQGHIPFKMVAMDEGVSVTLGLPIIRTSVDHGTAYDIAGKGNARENSLTAATRLAARFALGAQARRQRP